MNKKIFTKNAKNGSENHSQNQLIYYRIGPDSFGGCEVVSINN